MINFLNRFRLANTRRRAACVVIGTFTRPAENPGPLPKGFRPGVRRGISLLEVLISMFVLLFGLMGVASIFPVGNHYAGRSEQFDRSSALAQSGFADLKARGMLNPEHWFYATSPAGFQGSANVFNLMTNSIRYADATTGNFNFQPWSAPNDPHPGYAFVIDPMGAAAGNEQTPKLIPNHSFPGFDLSNGGAAVTKPTTTNWTKLYGSEWPIRRMSLLQSQNQLMTSPVAETIFRLHDDLANEFPKESDRPSVQRWSADFNGAPQNQPWNHKLLARQYAGGYSWLATVVPTSDDSLLALQPSSARFGSDLYEVSVAVFNKRDVLPSAESERLFQATINLGGELVLHSTNDQAGSDALDAAGKDIRAGQWIAVTGVHPTSGQFLLRWYRLLSFDNETLMDQTINSAVTGTYAVRRAMLDGPDWPAPITTAKPNGFPVEDVRAILLPGVISVATQMLPMDREQ